jgi:uncharacterized protein (TIGR03083 family)
MTDPQVIAGVRVPDLSTAYEGIRARVTELVEAAPPDALDAIAPATPEWRVRDVLAHLVGVPADVLAGNLDGVASDTWTEAQVTARRDLPVAEILAEWATNGPVVEPMVPDFGVMAGQAILDATTHEHDIRDALGAAGGRDSDAVHIGSAWVAQWMGAALAEDAHGPLRIETDLWAHTYGDGAPGTTIRTSAFELIRASTGRRSADQIEAFDWDGPPRVDVVVMAIFVPRATDFLG